MDEQQTVQEQQAEVAQDLANLLEELSIKAARLQDEIDTAAASNPVAALERFETGYWQLLKILSGVDIGLIKKLARGEDVGGAI